MQSSTIFVLSCICAVAVGLSPHRINDECDKPNEVFKACGTPCPATCKDQVVECPKYCVQGCFCEEGYIRDSEDGECIAVERCPAVKADPEVCTEENEEYNACGTACPLICGIEVVACTANCVPGCFCQSGYIRVEKGGKCIPDSACP